MTERAEEHYDIICNIDSISNLKKGWEFKYTKLGLENYDKRKNKRSCTVAVVGNANKGKSFILQKIAGDSFPSGYACKTEGLSLKYPKADELNFILFDTAGLETPLIKEKFYNLEQDMKKEKANKEKEESNDEEEKDDDLKNKIIELYARDKQTTEFFLQSFVTNNSNVLVLIMNAMTNTDQILLNKVKKQCGKGRKLFVIHNLQNFVTIQQCENYIEETLMKSLTFKLSKLPFVDFEENNNAKPKNKYYYREEVRGEDENMDDQLNVIHLIMANDGNNSEAGQYYNEVCIKFIKNQICTESNIKEFNAKEAIKKYFLKKAPEFLEKKVEENKENKESDEETHYLVETEKKLELKDSKGKPADVKLKKCLIDELGDESFQDSKFTPPFRVYKTKDKKMLIIELELAGDKTIKPECRAVGSNYKFLISGNKKTNFIKKEHEKLNWKRDQGSFYLTIELPMEKLPLKSKKVKNVENKNGIVKLFYELNEEEPDSD